jgi:hypothetical protein
MSEKKPKVRTLKFTRTIEAAPAKPVPPKPPQQPKKKNNG